MWYSSYGHTRLVRHHTPNRGSKQGSLAALNRIPVELKLKGLSSDPATGVDIILGRVVLSDFREESIGVFGSKSISVGSEVALRIEAPRSFYCLGEILFCIPMKRLSNIQSVVRYDYRIGIQFVFSSIEEKKWVSQYAREVANGAIRRLPETLQAGARELLKAVPETAPSSELVVVPGLDLEKKAA